MAPTASDIGSPDLAAHVKNPARLAALKRVALLDTPTEEAFDRLSALAVRFLRAPVALVTLVDAERQFFKSCIGLPEPWLSRRETPLSHSFCQHNRVPRQPLLIEDAREDPLFRDNLAIRDLHVIAYLGIPLVTPDGYVLGSFCVIDAKPRKWRLEEVRVVESLAEAVMTEIQLRTEIASRREAEKRLKARNEELMDAKRRLEKESAERIESLEQLREKDRVLMQQSRLAAMGEMLNSIAHEWRQPLNTVALVAQELPVTYRAGEFDAAYLDAMVHKIMGIVMRMSRTIEDFQSFFSPVQAKVSFSVVEAVKRTLSLLEMSLADSHIEAVVKVSGDPTVNGYPNEYAQVLLSILTNARDALMAAKVPERRIAVEVGGYGSRSLVTVSDNAGGMPVGIMERIFDPYFSTKGPGKGTGMGLYMAKVIIERSMGGRLMVSNVDGGARFTILV